MLGHDNATLRATLVRALIRDRNACRSNGDDERTDLQDLLATCPPLTILAEHVHAFAALLTTRRGQDLQRLAGVGALPRRS